MFEKNRMLFSLISGIVIFAVSTSVAYVFFNILESSAEASLQNWKLGGAFAGFVFTASLLTSITFQFYKQMTTDQISKYRDQIQELQAKLVKGAPRPEGYTIEVDEKHKLVFSRPEEWLPKAGILYQFVESRPPDLLPANFNVVYQGKHDLSDIYKALKLDPDNVDVNKLYDNIVGANIEFLKSAIPLYEDGTLTKEFIVVDGIKSLKSTHSYTCLSANGKDKMRMCQCAVCTYVPRLNALYQFTFSDNEEDYLKSSEVFNNVIQSIRFLP